MISRQWRGLVKTSCAEAYVRHLQSETFPSMRSLAGFVDASIFRRAVPEGVEFLIATRWTSLEAVRAFAGENVEIAVVPQTVRHMMIEYDQVVRHYDVVE